MINNLIFVLLLFWFLYLLTNFVVAKQNYTRNAKSSTASGHLDICSEMYPAYMSDEKSSSS